MKKTYKHDFGPGMEHVKSMEGLDLIVINSTFMGGETKKCTLPETFSAFREYEINEEHEQAANH